MAEQVLDVLEREALRELARTADRSDGLWKTKGTPSSTVLISKLQWETTGDTEWLTNVAGTLYFTAWDPDHGNTCRTRR